MSATEEEEREVHGVTRRDALTSIAAWSGAAAATAAVFTAEGFFGALGEDLYRTVLTQETREEIDKRYLSALFDLADGRPDIFAGTGNIRARALGQKGISEYLWVSSRTVLDFITCTLDVKRCFVPDNSDDVFKYDPTKQSIFLGSPVANSESRAIMGYKRALEDRPYAVPEINYNDTAVRWAFSFGQGDFGIYDGVKELAGRYAANSQLVEREVYKLIDKTDLRIAAPSTTDGMLNHEWMLITRRKDRGKFRTVIAGMHGPGTQSFFDDFRENLEKLFERTEGRDEYQVLVPVQLDHSAGLDGIHRTTGKLDWRQADLHVIR